MEVTYASLLIGKKIQEDNEALNKYTNFSNFFFGSLSRRGKPESGISQWQLIMLYTPGI